MRIQASASDIYQSSIRHNAIKLQTIIEILEEDKALHIALERGDRAELLEEAHRCLPTCASFPVSRISI